MIKHLYKRVWHAIPHSCTRFTMAYIVIPISLDANKSHFSPETKAHYEAQIKTITEDFEKERQDRVRAHERAEQLQDTVTRLKSQLDKQYGAFMADLKYRNTSGACPRYECDGSDDSAL